MYTNKVKKIAAVHDLSGAGRVSLTVLGPHGRDAQDYQ